MNPPPASTEPSSRDGTFLASLATFAIVAASACCFCSKGLFAKSAFAAGADPLTLLAVRMGLAFPFFLAGAWWTSRRRPAGGPGRLAGREWAALAGLGFLGYYLSSLVNFTGLQHVSVGLERMILYTYPSLVLAATAVRRRRLPSSAMVAAMALAWTGIAVAFSGEMDLGGTPPAQMATGAALVFASAVTYAAFVSFGAPLARRLGGMRFTSITVGFSCLCTVAHFLIVAALRGRPVPLDASVLVPGAFLAGLGTVVPAFLMGIGLQRAGARRFAVISTVGPVASLVLAAAVLGEPLGRRGLAGFGLCLAGGLAVTLLHEGEPGARVATADHGPRLRARRPVR